MKRVLALMSLLAVVLPASAFAVDTQGLWGPGYFRPEAPIGARVWFSEKIAGDIGLGFASSDATGDNLTDWILDVGLPIVVAETGNTMFFVRPGIAYESVAVNPDDDATAFSISGHLGVEHFLGDRFSVQVAHGVTWQSIEPPTGDSISQFFSEDFGISSIGFHYYFGGGK
jgi:hypothetical protein